MITDDILVAYKKGSNPVDEDKGWIVPVFRENKDGEYEGVNSNEYPNDIYISKGYDEINFGEGEFFLLKQHTYDSDRSSSGNMGPYYYATARDTLPLKKNSLVPVIEGELPSEDKGLLSKEISPPTDKAFFLFSSGIYYGPLAASYDSELEMYSVSPKAAPVFNPKNDHVASFAKEILKPYVVTTIIFEQTRSFVTSLKSLSNLEYLTIDYISNEKLVNYFSSLGLGKDRKPELVKKDAKRLQDSIAKWTKGNSVSPERKERIGNLLGEYLKDADIGSDLVRNFLSKSEDGKKFLNGFVQENKTLLLKEHQDTLKEEYEVQKESIKTSLDEINKRVEFKQKELIQINTRVDEARTEARDKINEIERSTDAETETILADRQETLQKMISSLEEHRDTLEETCNDFFKKQDQIKDYEALVKKTDYLQYHKDILGASAKEISASIRDSQKLAQKMVEVKFVTDVMKGASQNNPTEIVPVDSPALASNQPNEAKGLIEKVTYAFESDSGKGFSFDEMANLLVSMTQSFITILSGPPGVGKTSTAIRLAKFMHMGTVDGKQNFLNIPVGRGWTSSRDILGFYNPLKGDYQSSKTGLYNFLRQGQNEEYQISPRLVLLDEANLSGIEHYWSDFLGMCDPEGRGRHIETGCPTEDMKYLKVGKNVRFIASINNDATTERLSSRMIDRAPVISLENYSDLESNFDGVGVLDGAIEYSLLEGFFAPQEQAELGLEEKKKLDAILEILNRKDTSLGQPVDISARKIAAITSYWTVISPLLETEEALDFAVAQHILPHIEGYGNNFKKRLDELRVEFNKEINISLPRSQAILDRIISSGSEFTNTYSFF